MDICAASPPLIRNDEGMTVVVIDTNAVHRDPWLKNAPGTALVALADGGECVLVLPKVVTDELRRQQHDWVELNRAEVSKTIQKMRGNPVDVQAITGRLAESFNDLDAQIDSSFDTLLAQAGVEEEAVPTDITARLVERDLARRRPFIEEGSGPWSAGFRDAVIWETVLVRLSRLPVGDKLILVTADKGFLSDSGNSLHEDLLNDLDERRIAHDRVICAQTTFLARTQVESLAAAATEEAANRAELVRVATDSLYALDGQDISIQMVYSGDYDYPDFVKFQVPPMESATIVAIDQNTDYRFEETVDGIKTGSAEVSLYIEGATFKDDYYVEDVGALEVHGELNDHYLATGTTVEVRAVVDIDVNGGAGTYQSMSITLEDL